MSYYAPPQPRPPLAFLTLLAVAATALVFLLGGCSTKSPRQWYGDEIRACRYALAYARTSTDTALVMAAHPTDVRSVSCAYLLSLP